MYSSITNGFRQKWFSSNLDNMQNAFRPVTIRPLVPDLPGTSKACTQVFAH